MATTFTSHRNSRSPGLEASASVSAARACLDPDGISWRPRPVTGKMHRMALGCITQFSISPRRSSEMPISAWKAVAESGHRARLAGVATSARAFSSTAVVSAILPEYAYTWARVLNAAA